MIHAAFDSSLKCTLVIADDARILFSGELEAASRDNDRKLPPWLMGAVAQCNLKLEDIRQWTVGTGPGSFAGLRSGIAFILGICSVTGAQLRGVPSAIATAAQCTQKGRIGVVMDGRCGEVIFIPVRNGVIDGEAQAMQPAELLNQACDGWITPQPTLIPPLPDEIRGRLQVCESINPVALLDSQSPWPVSLQETVKNCEPMYVRPPVFVQPVQPRSI